MDALPTRDGVMSRQCITRQWLTEHSSAAPPCLCTTNQIRYLSGTCPLEPNFSANCVLFPLFAVWHLCESLPTFFLQTPCV